MSWLAALAALLQRSSGCHTLTIGTYASTRGRPELDELIGYFVNLLVLRIEVDPRRAFGDLLDHVRTTGASPRWTFPGCNRSGSRRYWPASPGKLTVVADEGGTVTAGFDPRRYVPAGVRAMLAELVQLVERASAAPERRVADLAPPPRPPAGWLRRVLGSRVSTE